jgi:hypothetical protein
VSSLCIESDSTTTREESYATVGGPHAHGIHVGDFALLEEFGGSNGMVRQAQGIGEIIAATSWKNPQDCVREARQGIYEVLEGAVPPQHQEARIAGCSGRRGLFL